MSVGKKWWRGRRDGAAFVRCEDGASALEYAVIAAFLSVAVVVSVQNLGTSVRDNLFMSVQNALALEQGDLDNNQLYAETPASDPIITGGTGQK